RAVFDHPATYRPAQYADGGRAVQRTWRAPHRSSEFARGAQRELRVRGRRGRSLAAGPRPGGDLCVDGLGMHVWLAGGLPRIEGDGAVARAGPGQSTPEPRQGQHGRCRASRAGSAASHRRAAARGAARALAPGRAMSPIPEPAARSPLPGGRGGPGRLPRLAGRRTRPVLHQIPQDHLQDAAVPQVVDLDDTVDAGNRGELGLTTVFATHTDRELLARSHASGDATDLVGLAAVELEARPTLARLEL